jgi:SAM-dependent methyltransferase
MSDTPQGRGAAALYASDVRDLEPEQPELQRVSPCPVCGVNEARPRFEVASVASQVVVCGECGLGRFHPMPGVEEVRAFYPDAYYGEPGTKFQPLIERLVRLIGARHIAFLSRGLGPRARVLDVGCGRGVILGALADRGFEVHGVEISAEAARGADPRAEIRIARKLSDAGYADETFDEVIIWHVLEHLDDPRGAIEEIHRILRPGGRLIVAVPNFGSLQARWSGSAWFHLDLPRHLYHFPLPALKRLLARCGFRVDSEHHFSLRQNPFGWIQSALNQRAGLPRNGLYALLHRPGTDAGPPAPAGLRLRLLLWLVLLAPLAAVLTLLESGLRQGATVHVVARRG